MKKVGKSRKKNKKEVLTLAYLPERERLFDLQQEIDSYRDEISGLDWQITNLRAELARFEVVYNSHLASEQRLIRRVRSVLHYLEEWTDILSSPSASLSKKEAFFWGQIAERRRATEVAKFLEEREEREWRPREAPADEKPRIEEAPRPSLASFEKLKTAYRDLARHYHPDLATSEEDRIRFSDIMSRINELYRAGDLEQLLALAEQQKGTPELLNGLTLKEQIEFLEERAEWFASIVTSLTEELAEIESSDICELWYRDEKSRKQGKDLIGEIKASLQGSLHSLYEEIGQTIAELDKAVRKYNGELTSRPPALKRQQGSSALERVFDPFVDKGLVRLGLEALDVGPVDRPTERRVKWISGLAEKTPGQLRLLLLTHIAELSHLPLPGLETYEDLRLRFNALVQDDELPSSLEQALAETADILEYGVRRADSKFVHLGLRYRSENVCKAMPLALKDPVVKREFKRALWVLGEYITCSGCQTEVFAIPHYYIRGLDDLRATGCPRCGEVVRRYYLPKGDDLQAVLNPAYIDLDIITDWSFRLGRTSVSTQLLPVQVANYTVGDLKTRLVKDLFERYELGVRRGQVAFYQGTRRVREKTPLYEVPEQNFEIRFREDASLSETEAVEVLRHRIRNKFK